MAKSYYKKWRALHPEANAVYIHKKRAVAAGRLSTFSRGDWPIVVAKFDGACAYCGATGVKLEMDHVVPIAKGGNFVVGNIVPACIRCNRSKHDRDLADFVGEDRAAEIVEKIVEV